jgi:plasmid stabilization system protein ParE
VIPYRFSARARRDAAKIIGKLHVQSSPIEADEFEEELFAALDELSRLNGAGCRRPEITSKNLLFYKVAPYVLVFRRQKKILVIVRVLHAASDLAKYL